MKIFSKDLLIDQYDWKLQNFSGTWYGGTQMSKGETNYANYYIVGENADYLKSTNGITWERQKIPNWSLNIYDIVSPFDKSDFICGGEFFTYGSANSNLWVDGTVTTGVNWQHCLYVPDLNKYVATGGAYLAYATPPNPGQSATWTITNQTDVLGGFLLYIPQLNTLLTGGSSARISTSTDIATWTRSQVGTDTNIIWSAAATNGTIVAMVGYKSSGSGYNYITTSTDLTNWTTPVQIASGAGVVFNPKSMAYKNGQWFVIGTRTQSYKGGYATSGDLTNWTVDSMPVGNEWYKVIAAKTGWIVAGKDYVGFREY